MSSSQAGITPTQVLACHSSGVAYDLLKAEPADIRKQCLDWLIVYSENHDMDTDLVTEHWPWFALLALRAGNILSHQEHVFLEALKHAETTLTAEAVEHRRRLLTRLLGQLRSAEGDEQLSLLIDVIS